MILQQNKKLSTAEMKQNEEVYKSTSNHEVAEIHKDRNKNYIVRIQALEMLNSEKETTIQELQISLKKSKIELDKHNVNMNNLEMQIEN